MANASDLLFPRDFVWGAATASYQVEGAAYEDGRSESIWDRFCRTPGKVRNGDTGDIACDHYHRYKEDVALMRALGLRGYRFSISWPRILPDGRGSINPRGLDFYDRLVDELLRNGIEPYATLYHWDLPQVLEDRGGWTNRDTADAFVEYAEAVLRRLGDRVRYWITQNEPWVTAWLGYGWGVHAPGRTGEGAALAAAHHLLISHGRAMEVIRRESPDAQAGITLNLAPAYGASDAQEDQQAARTLDGINNRWFLDAIFRGEYPADAAEALAPYLPEIRADDLRTISAPIDFLGVNYYNRQIVRASPETGNPMHVRPEGSSFTDMNWEVYPEAFYELLMRLQREYAPGRLFVTENGAAYDDVRIHDGSIRDPERQSYLEQHLIACSRAIRDGVGLAGYFAWSLLDNFEWAYGYQKRFGLVYVDYPTQERIPKSSFEWYRRLIQGQAAEEQNSLPSGSAITIQPRPSVMVRSRCAPRAIRRSASASLSTTLMSRCTRFFTDLGSGTRRKSRRGPVPRLSCRPAQPSPAPSFTTGWAAWSDSISGSQHHGTSTCWHRPIFITGGAGWPAWRTLSDHHLCLIITF
jgi:beta-glucosidase